MSTYALCYLTNNAHIEQQNEAGVTPLLIAAQNGHFHICTMLLENKSHVNQTMEDGTSSLSLAVQEGYVHVCALLLENNAHIEQQSDAGVTPLLIAAQKGHFHICTLLLENNAHVNQEMEDGTSALFLAAQEGHFHICHLLLEYNADVNIQRNNGSSPLMIASFFGHIEVCQYLLQNKAFINLKDKTGQNALFYAVRKKKYDICKLLIHHDIDVNVIDNDGIGIHETANATHDNAIISFIKENQNVKTVNKEIEETRKYLKKLQVKQIISRKKENLAEMENEKVRLDELKQLLLENYDERDNMEAVVKVLVEDKNGRANRLSKLTSGNNQIKLLLQQQNAECQAMIDNILEKISGIIQMINKYVTEVKAIEVSSTDYERQKRKYKFYEKCFQEGKYNEIIKYLNKECPICFEEMLTPIKIFQCSQGHLLCEICFKKVSESTKVCPFCKRDVVTTPIRNRALEEAIENEARKDMGATRRN